MLLLISMFLVIFFSILGNKEMILIYFLVSGGQQLMSEELCPQLNSLLFFISIIFFWKPMEHCWLSGFGSTKAQLYPILRTCTTPESAPTCSFWPNLPDYFLMRVTLHHEPFRSIFTSRSISLSICFCISESWLYVVLKLFLKQLVGPLWIKEWMFLSILKNVPKYFMN